MYWISIIFVQLSLSVREGLVLGPTPLPPWIPKSWCLSPWYKMVYYLHITCEHLLIYFKSSVVYSSFLITTWYKIMVAHVANSSFAFWNFLRMFFLWIFVTHCWLNPWCGAQVWRTNRIDRSCILQPHWTCLLVVTFF